MRSPLQRLAVLASALALAPPLGATTLIERTLDELALRADCVVVGVPGDRRSRWRRGLLETDVQLRVTHVLRGGASCGVATLVRLPGGSDGDLRQVLLGAPELEAGRGYVLFLDPAREGARTVSNLSAGALPLVSRDGEVRVLPAQTEGLTLVRTSPAVASLRLPAEGLSLDRFVAWVRALRP